MSKDSFRLPKNTEHEDAVNFLTWEQFPAAASDSVSYYQFLPQIGTYKHFNEGVMDFKKALLETTERQHVLSGVGSLLDYEKFGHLSLIHI